MYDQMVYNVMDHKTHSKHENKLQTQYIDEGIIWKLVYLMYFLSFTWKETI